MYDYEKAKESASARCSNSNLTSHNPMLLNVAAGPALDAVDYKQLQWPGHGVRDDQPYQYLDREYMKADEYDEFIVRPHRLLSAQISAARLPACSRASRNCPICPACIISVWSAAVRGFGRPKLRAAFERILKAAEEVDRLGRAACRLSPNTWRRSASPLRTSATSVAPYDLIADYFRGATGMMKDLYRKKDKLLQLLDKACTFLTRQTIACVEGLRAPDRVLPDPLGAGCFHVAGAVQDLLVADASAR